MSLHKTLPREDTVGGQGEMEEGSRDVQKVPQITHCVQIGSEVGKGARSDDQRPAVNSLHETCGDLPTCQTRGSDLVNLPCLLLL